MATAAKQKKSAKKRTFDVDKLTTREALALLQEEIQLEQVDARADFLRFVQYINRSYDAQWFHKLIARKCQDVFEGKIKNLMLFMPPQHGKALAVDTEILTANRGWQRHGALRAGDTVFAPDGSRVLVRAVTQPYLWRCREVKFASGKSIIASFNHEWGCYVPNSHHKVQYFANIETDEIKRKMHDRSAYIKSAGVLNYDWQVLAIPPYLLGLWLGDGCSQHKQICKSVDDCEFFLSQYDGKIQRIKDNAAYITFEQLDMTKLKSIGVLGDKHIPQQYLQAAAQQRIELLQGLLDTDGYCDKRGRVEIIQVRETLALQIVELLRTLGYKPTLTIGDATLKGRVVSKKYRIAFSPDRDDDVFRLPRKLVRLRNKTAKDRDDKYKHFITAIEDYGDTLVNCIEVEGGYYLAGRELIPTHNSELVSRQFPAWVLGKNPNMKIIGASYSSDLSEQFSRTIQQTISSDEYRALFSNIELGGKNYAQTLNTFQVRGNQGFYKAVGVMGSLTGTPADIAIIDDPVKDALEAGSPTYRERVWEWYNSVLLTRLHNGSRQLFIMTRWHDDDLAGRILKREAQDWEVISIPAICEREQDGGLTGSERHIGEALWQSRHSIERLRAAQVRAPRFFSALYQQHPTIDGGNIVKRDWFVHITRHNFNNVMQRDSAVMHFFVDTAYTDNINNDPTGIIAACRIDNRLFISAATQQHMRFPDLCRFLPDWVKDNGYTYASTLRIEPKANGLSVIDQLREITQLNVTQTQSPRESKETRLIACSPFVESGRVVLVDGDWCEAFTTEVCGFPAVAHDEFVDLLCYAINYFFGEQSREGLSAQEMLDLI
jgi:predicted phage terminase large subunit-like protein